MAAIDKQAAGGVPHVPPRWREYAIDILQVQEIRAQ